MPFGKAAPTSCTVGAALFLLCGCGSGPSGSSKKQINTLLAQQNFSAAEQFVDGLKESEYKKKNMVLFYLDKGLIEHHEGKYKESDQSLDAAEKRMEELFTKSVTKTAGMLVLNDNTVDYAGEPYERALTNVFRALNFVFLNQPEEALVESRKVEQFLQELNDRLGGKKVYKDDAFARYLDSLLYADEGKMDDARISMEAATQAYAWYAKDYNTPEPRFEFPKNEGPHGELVFVHYNGIAPRKISKTFQIAWGQAIALAQQSNDPDKQQFENGLRAGILGHAITVSYPEYVQDPFTIAGSEVKAGEEAPGETVLMEDVSAIATKTLADRNALIKTRAIARATIKFVIAEAVAKAAKDACARQYGANSWQCLVGGGAARMTAHGVAAATEVADTRSWTTLPSQIRMARLKLPVGKHDVRVDFKNAAGGVVSSHVFKDVQIRKSKRTYLSLRTAL
ncbi:MAG: hypothetical protein HY077_00920 [Elusimicrobia bacterium]|nr:hypothetical protein [Elusimicrobiota bacterium]